MSRDRLPFDKALALVPDHLPDGAAFAMAHDMAGIEYGAGFDQIDAPARKRRRRRKRKPATTTNRGPR